LVDVSQLHGFTHASMLIASVRFRLESLPQ
jgi:hypothetical protein